ncbi:MAG: DegV family EDD domain-containing protein, partial [Clostridia bacterium]|nr:DegV family EDD domain-containing protein [Clostridia bacterium]
MSKVALVVDNSAAMSKEDLKRANVTKLVPISFIVNGEEYYENETMTHADFYNFLMNKDTDLNTSQPSIEMVKDAWREVLKDYDELIYIILSSGLSGACNSAQNASHEDEFEGRVFVANNQRVSYMNKMAMFEASHLIKQGKSALEIKEYLEHTSGECGAYIAVDT